MSEPVLRLDRSKTFGECHGERTEDDPQYRVVHWQGGKLNDGGKVHTVNLPFDAQDELIPDDGRTEPFKGKGIDRNGNLVEVTYHPLYDAKMRKYLAAKLQKMASSIPSVSGFGIEEEGDDGLVEEGSTSQGAGVDLVAWLKGHKNYAAHQIRAAMRERGRVIQKIGDIVIDLVLDEQIVPESAVCPDLVKYLSPQPVAA